VWGVAALSLLTYSLTPPSAWANGTKSVVTPRVQFKVTKINSPAYSSLRIRQTIFAVASEGATVWVTVSRNKLAHGVFVARGTVQKITP
jgi:hypothetical protein